MNSDSDGPSAPQGRAEPRLWTPPLRDLGTAEHPNYDATYGWDVIAFARDVLGQPLDPWQEFVVVHAGELLPDGRPRFRTVLVLVARQNGKTFLLKVLALYWLFVERHEMILGTSTTLSTAKESWTAAINMAESSPYLSEEIANIRRAAGEEALIAQFGGRYKIAAANRRGGRGLTIHRLILDELREHETWDAYDAAVPATSAVFNAQVWGISNLGDDKSVVLDALRRPALEFLETGQGDPRLGLFEWSAPAGADPCDLEALAYANPSLGGRMDPDVLLGAARRAVLAGGAELAGFRTEVMNQRVAQGDPAIEPAAWTAAASAEPFDFSAHRRTTAYCLDVSLAQDHVSLVGAVKVGDVVHVAVRASWTGPSCVEQARTELPGLLEETKPAVLGWFENGPTAALTADLEQRPGRSDWPPRGMRVEKLGADMAPACMGLAEQVLNGHVSHGNDPMLNHQVGQAERLRHGDRWVFGRRGSGPIDGAYALAGAVHLARTLRVRPPMRPVRGSDQAK